MKADYFQYMEMRVRGFPVSRNRIQESEWMSELTRGQVDNENNNQS